MRAAGAALALALLTSAPGAAQPTPEIPGGEEAARGRSLAAAVGLRLGVFLPLQSSDSYDAVYGDPLPQLGVELEVRWRRHVFLALAWETGSVDGEQVLLTRPPTPTGVASTLTLQPLHLTAGWVFAPEARWSWRVGVGATLLSWEEELSGRTTSSTDSGFHALGGVERSLGRWAAGLEARWSTVPNALGEGGASDFFDEDDLGGLAGSVVLRRRWGGTDG